MRIIVQMGYQQGIAHKNVPIISVISVYKEKRRVLWMYIMQRGEEDSGLVSQSGKSSLSTWYTCRHLEDVQELAKQSDLKEQHVWRPWDRKESGTFEEVKLHTDEPSKEKKSGVRRGLRVRQQPDFTGPSNAMLRIWPRIWSSLFLFHMAKTKCKLV